MRKLYHNDGAEAAIGDAVTSLRGETGRIVGWNQNGRTRVYVTLDNMPKNCAGEYFVSVFNLTWDKPNA